MCGILASNNKDIIATKLYEQMGRGIQGAGYALDTKAVYKSANIFDVFGKFSMEWKHAKFGMFHHRFPTSTTNTDETAHPFYHPTDKNLVGIHNGVISNPAEVLGELTKTKWYVRNDSQAIIYEIMEAIKNPKDITRKSVGYAAVMVMDLRTKKFYVYKDTKAPLFLVKTKDFWLISSEKLKNGGGEAVPDDTLFEVKNGRLEKICKIKKPKEKPITYTQSYHKYSGNTIYHTVQNGINYMFRGGLYVLTEDYDMLKQAGMLSEEIFTDYGCTYQELGKIYY